MDSSVQGATVRAYSFLSGVVGSDYRCAEFTTLGHQIALYRYNQTLTLTLTLTRNPNPINFGMHCRDCAVALCCKLSTPVI